MEKRVYSYHTFVLPFFWEMPGVEADKEYRALRDVFDDNIEWENNDLKDPVDINSKYDVDTFDEIKGLYKEYQYYYPFVRKSFYGYEDDICTNYLLKQSRNNGEYRITKGNKTYVLNINAIKLRIVNTGIALFVMECENRKPDQRDIESIKDINDYGRRITLPFIDTFCITADKLVLDIPGIGIFEDNFLGYAKSICENSDTTKDNISLVHMCDFIKEVLSFGGKYRFTSYQTVRKDEIHVCPILDDRMYVAFAVENNDVVSRAKDLEGEDSLYGVKDGELSKSLYEIAYADNSGGCSCPDAKLRAKQIEEAMYNRWAPMGTFYTITEIGFGMISSAEIGGDVNYLYDNFLNCYLQMVYITLVQRASIVKFSREAADIARHFSANGKKPKREDIRNIMNLQERHSAFDNQLLFSQVSSELQAGEMYDMLKTSFKLTAENEILDKNLESLYEITNTQLNMSVNTGVGILTALSIILAVGALGYNFLFAGDVKIICADSSFTGMPEADVWVFIIIMAVASFLATVIVLRRNRRK